MKKIALALVLFVCAGFIAFYTKDVIDRQYPEYAVAKLTVSADATDVPVVVSGFEWSFVFGGTAAKSSPDVAELAVTPVSVLGGETLSLVFSQPLKTLEVKRSESYSYTFSDIQGDLKVPFEAGGYMYEVNASFERGNVKYYFYIVVE